MAGHPAAALRPACTAGHRQHLRRPRRDPLRCAHAMSRQRPDLPDVAASRRTNGLDPQDRPHHAAPGQPQSQPGPGPTRRPPAAGSSLRPHASVADQHHRTLAGPAAWSRSRGRAQAAPVTRPRELPRPHTPRPSRTTPRPASTTTGDPRRSRPSPGSHAKRRHHVI